MGRIDNYPGLRKAALEIAYNNGMINRVQSEAEYLSSLDVVLVGFPLGDLRRWDMWISSLSDEDLTTACAGEESAMLVLLDAAPLGTNSDRCLHDLLNEMFEVSQ